MDNNFSTVLENTKKNLVILLYHGVTGLKNNGIHNLQGKHISDKVFRDQMEYIKLNCYPISIEDWIQIRDYPKDIPDNPVIVTFDDGYENNFSKACPILEELKLPSVFFVSSGLIGTDKMFWVDILEDSINRSNLKEIEVTLSIKKNFDISSVKTKFQSLKEIKRWCKNENNHEKERVVKEIINVTQVEPNNLINENYKILNWDQVIEMDRNNLFTIGCHGLNHSILTSLTTKELEFDVKESIRIINDQLGKPTTFYSYPEGQINHFNQKVIGVLKNHGIKCSPSAVQGLNEFEDDLFFLKRLMVGFEDISFPYF